MPPEPPLRLYPGQHALTTAQVVEAERFASERIGAQLSTAPVDETAAENLLCRAYAAARVAAPNSIHWLDGPLELVAVLAHEDQRSASTIAIATVCHTMSGTRDVWIRLRSVCWAVACLTA